MSLCKPFISRLILFLKQPVVIFMTSSYQLLNCTVLHEAAPLTDVATLLYFPYYSPAKPVCISASALLSDCSSTLWHLVVESLEDVIFLQHASAMNKAEIWTKKEKEAFSYEKKLTL